MLKLLFALPALALGQEATLTEIDGQLTMERRQQIDIAAMSAIVARQEAQIAMLLEGQGPLNNWSMSVEGRATANQIRIEALEGALSATVASVDRELDSARSSMAATAAAIAAEASAAADEAEDAAESRAVVADAAATALESRLNTAMSSATASLTRSLSSTVAQVNTGLQAMNVSLANKKDNQPKIWSGGCSRHPGSSWHDYCLDRQLYYTAQGKFVKHNNRDFRSLLNNAMIRFTPWTITYGSGWNIMQMYLNGQSIYYSYSHTWQCWWKDMHGNLIFKADAGHRWYVRYHGACGHAFHNGGRLTDHHSRITVEYLGQHSL
jgi:hypothetical protein